MQESSKPIIIHPSEIIRTGHRVHAYLIKTELFLRDRPMIVKMINQPVYYLVNRLVSDLGGGGVQ